MVNEVVEAIRQAEELADRMLDEAKREARDTINQAHQDAQLKAQEMENEARKKAQDTIQMTESYAKKKAQVLIENHREALDARYRETEKNMPGAVEAILERVGCCGN